MPWICDMELDDMLDPEAAPRACRRIADAAGDRMQELTKRFTPVDRSFGKDTSARPRGTARESIYRTPVEERLGIAGATFRVRVVSDDPVFPYIEWNTRPHVIRPRPERGPRARLSWRTPSGRVFAREVHHPGTQGQHPFARGELQVRGEVGRIARGPLARFERELVAKQRSRG